MALLNRRPLNLKNKNVEQKLLVLPYKCFHQNVATPTSPLPPTPHPPLRAKIIIPQTVVFEKFVAPKQKRGRTLCSCQMKLDFNSVLIFRFILPSVYHLFERPGYFWVTVVMVSYKIITYIETCFISETEKFSSTNCLHLKDIVKLVL